MAIRDFYLKIEDDTIFFRRVDLDRLAGLAEGNADSRWLEVLSSSPKVVDITHLRYTPHLDSEWNGTDFLTPLGKNLISFGIGIPFPNPKRFAFLVDNKYKMSYLLEDNLNNEGMIAALSSDPTIVMEEK